MAVSAGALLLAMRYGPQLAAAGRAALARYQGQGQPPGGPADELTVSEFRAGLAGPMNPKQWENERWGMDQAS